MAGNSSMSTSSAGSSTAPPADAAAPPPAESLADTSIVDAELAPPQGEPCPACGCPLEAADRFCPACGTPHAPSEIVEATTVDEAPGETGDDTEPEPEKKHLRCDNCGAEIATDPDQRSFICPFCDSTYVVEYAGTTGRQPPEFVIGFAFTRDQAEERFRQWLNEKSWVRPKDLNTAQMEGKLKGIYLPFWSFSMLAESSWSAKIGEHWYRTETYTTRDSKGRMVTRTRRVQETEWWPLSGRHHKYYSGYLVSGSKGLPQSQADRIQPFQLPALKRYKPFYLAGWLAEEYSINGDQALATCREVFRQREKQNIAAFLPGDTHRGLLADTTFRHIHSDLCLLPVYLVSYRYQDKLYRFLMNGQTGRVSGDKPLSYKRIGWAIAARGAGRRADHPAPVPVHARPGRTHQLTRSPPRTP